jgi:hypothetical protein
MSKLKKAKQIIDKQIDKKKAKEKLEKFVEGI